MKKESPLMYSFSTNAIHLGILKWKESLLMYSLSIRQFILEFETGKKVHLCIRFQLGNAFGNAKMERKSTYAFVFN